MANTYLSGCVNMMLDRINASRDLLEVFKGRSFSAFLRRLKVALVTANGVLADAEQKADRVREVKYWLTELTDAFFQAEDVLDEIAAEALKRRVVAEDGGFGGRIRNLITGPEALQKKMEPKIEEVVRRLEHLVNHIEVMGLREYSGPLVPLQRQWSPSSPDFPQHKVVGREGDKQAIVNLLLSDDEIGHWKPDVISIVGMPGVGKTTLAQVVFNDNRVTEHFDLKVWICIGKIFDVFRVTKAVLQEITSAAVNTEDLPSLQVKLKDTLSEKRFLLVLDDFWAEGDSEWESFQVSLTDGLKGSKIVLTTRSEIVCAITQSIQSYQLKLMTDEDCWELILRSAFGNISVGSINPELEGIGKKIAKQCKGLPLAAKAFASHLRTKPNLEEWCAVSRNFSDYTVGVLPVLKLSYDSLSSQLKRCFAFCSIFPKGYLFDREKLVLLWMAIGLLHQQRSNKRLEDIGYEYLNELVARSFFLPVDVSRTSFVMHDLMNDLAKSVSGDFCCRVVDSKTSQIPDKARHFSFSGSQCDASIIFETIRGAKLLRTILPFDLPQDLESPQLTDSVLHDLLLELRHLRVLCLSHYHITSLPESLDGLKHLRYLDFSSTRIRVLPDFVCMLYNLQTLLLSNCCSLARLPTNMEKLINLRYLDLVGTPLREMPTGISKLRSLQKLSNFVMGRLSGAGLRGLKELSYLRGTLHISELQNVAFATEAKDAGLGKKPFLDGLVLTWKARVSKFYRGNVNALACDPREVLKQLKPHPNLKTLSVESYGGATFPNWLGDPSFSNIVSVSLRSCNLCLSLPPLGQLPSLEDLVIEKFNGLVKVGQEFFYGENDPPLGPFQSLKSLEFNGMPRWEEWSCPEIEGGIFPCLRELVIRKCPRLTKNFPEGLPISTIVTIFDCPLLRVSGEASNRAIPPGMTASPNSSRSMSGKEESSSTESQIITAPETNQINDEADITPGQSFLKEQQPRTEAEVLSGTEYESSSHHSEQIDVISVSYPEYVSENLTDIHSISGPHRLRTPTGSSFQDTGYGGSNLPENRSYQPYPKPSAESPHSVDAGKMGPPLDQNGLEFESLKVTEISQLTELHPGLQSLHIEGCHGLDALPEALMGSSPYLHELFITDCHSLESFPGGHPPTTLKTLYVRDCMKLEFAGSLQTMRSYSQLEYLFIGSSCSSLQSFPLVLFPKLKSLSIRDCENFSCFWVHAGLGDDRIALEALEIRDCPNLKVFPKGGLPTPKLTSMLLSNCKNLCALPVGLFRLNSLLSLFMKECPELETIPGGGFPRNLRTLFISHCHKLTPRVEWRLCDLKNLYNLEIEAGCNDIESFPEEGLLPQSLYSLRISEFPNLKTLNYKGLGDLTELEMLEISGSDKLLSLPGEGLPSSLSYLCINNCELLTEKLPGNETEWHKVSHIQQVMIDGEMMS